jgi:hypothetical protein
MADPKKKPVKAGPPKLRVPGNVDTHYSNMVRIAHTPSEIIFDFARFLPGEPHAHVVSRVLTSPVSAKLLLKALTENLAKYEASFGEITIPKKQSLADFLFNPPKSEDEPESE